MSCKMEKDFRVSGICVFLMKLWCNSPASRSTRRHKSRFLIVTMPLKYYLVYFICLLCSQRCPKYIKMGGSHLNQSKMLVQSQPYSSMIVQAQSGCTEVIAVFYYILDSIIFDSKRSHTFRFFWRVGYF